MITGGAGFLGSYVTPLFLEHGYDVVLLVRRNSSLDRLDKFVGHKKLQVLFYEDGIEKCFEKPVDCVIHLATCFGRDKDSVADVVSTNLLLPVILLERAARSDCRGFINADTFFNTKLGLTLKEKSYMVTKKALLDLSKSILVGSRLKFINMRIEQMYGPMDNDKKFVPTIIKELLSTKSSLNLTKGEQKRDFIFVGDAARAFVQTVKNFDKLGAWEEFGVGTGKTISIKKSVSYLKKLTGSDIELRWGALPYRRNEIMISKANLKNNKKIGWKAATSWEEGLRITVESFRNLL